MRLWWRVRCCAFGTSISVSTIGIAVIATRSICLAICICCCLPWVCPLSRLSINKYLPTLAIRHCLLWRSPACHQVVDIVSHPRCHRLIHRSTAPKAAKDTEVNRSTQYLFHLVPPILLIQITSFILTRRVRAVHWAFSPGQRPETGGKKSECLSHAETYYAASFPKSTTIVCTLSFSETSCGSMTVVRANRRHRLDGPAPGAHRSVNITGCRPFDHPTSPSPGLPNDVGGRRSPAVGLAGFLLFPFFTIRNCLSLFRKSYRSAKVLRT